MDFKLLGSILLIVGTSIGAGMLALPIVAAQLGFVGSLVLLVGCWAVMTASAFVLLEVNLWLPQNSNLISMAKATIGPVGQLVSWAAYLLLLYSLLCAYIAGGSDLFHNLLLIEHIDVPIWASAIVFTLVFGSVVYLGIRSVDYVNRGLMFFKLGAYLLLVILLMPLISMVNLASSEVTAITLVAATMVTITSFGFSVIVPSLRIYFAGDVRKLKMAIVFGSIVPLICYILWDAAIMGVIPLHGIHGLGAMLDSPTSTSDLVNTLTATAAKGSVNFFAKLFTSVCVLTSFLGVSLCLSDFWADGLQLENKGGNKLIIFAITFLPPLLIVLFFPDIFIKALEYAGIYCLILQVIIPAWMVWFGRYRRQIAHGFKVPGGQILIISLVLFAIAMIVLWLFLVKIGL